MKKLFTIVLALTLIVTSAEAQAKFGIKGGLNFNRVSDVHFSSPGSATLENSTGFNLGVLMQFKVPIIGISVQPELIYTTKGSIVKMSLPQPETAVKLDYLELPVNLQWGIDLLLLRPYLQLSPYLSYAIGKSDMLNDISWDNLNRVDYGVGLGAGVEVWKFQLSGKYNWSFGNLGKSGEPQLKNAKLKGFQLSLAYLF